MTVTFNALALYADMQRFQGELDKEAAKPLCVYTIAIKCLMNAQKKTPNSHPLAAHIDRINKEVTEAATMSSTEIRDHIKSLADLVAKVAQNATLHRIQSVLIRSTAQLVSQCQDVINATDISMKENEARIQALEKEMSMREISILNREIGDKMHLVKENYPNMLRSLKEGFDSKMIECTIDKWSKIALQEVKGSPPSTSIFTNSVKVWNCYVWIKVVKKAADFGLYLCCGAGPLGSGRPFTISPIKMEEQLMVRKRGSDGAIVSVKFITHFTKEEAWGLSSFAPIGAIESSGGYHKVEDAITFGIKLYPYENLRWGFKACKMLRKK